MGHRSRISELASLIQQQTEILDRFHTQHGIDSPSFDLSTPLSLAPQLLEAQGAILAATEELGILVQGPLPYLTSFLTSSHNVLISIQAISRFNIAEAVPVDGSATFTEISQRCNLSLGDTKRLIRHACTYRIFREPSKGIVQHTPVSKILVDMPLVKQLVGQACEDMWPAAARVVDAMVQWPSSEEPYHTGFNLANDTQDTIFATFDRNPTRAKRFADTMIVMGSRPGFEFSHVVDNYGWLPSSDASDSHIQVVDIGGSHGHLATEILHRFPGISCVVQDLPGVIQTSPSTSERLRFMAHDFFTVQPIHSADIYILRHILHDWSDKYAIQILKNLVPALKAGARVLVNEICIPEPGTLSCYQERPLRVMDIAMKEIQNAKERDADDWAELFHTADPRFRLSPIRTPAGSELSIIEAVWSAE